MSDTPKHWKEYVEEIKRHNEAMRNDAMQRKIDADAEYDKLPWYLKLVKSRPSEVRWGLDYVYFEVEPTLIGYYNWDVNERKEKV